MSTEGLIGSAAGGALWDSRLVMQYLRRRWVRALERALDEIHDSGSAEDLLAFIGKNLPELTQTPRPWKPGLGRFLLNEKTDVGAFVQVALQCCASGGLGSWRCRLDEDVIGYFDLHPLRLSGSVCCVSEPDAVTLTCETRGQTRAPIRFIRQRDGWVNGENEPPQSCVTASEVSCRILHSDLFVAQLVADQQPSHTALPELAATLAESLEAIGRHAPLLLRWIAEVLAGIAFVAPVRRATGSGSVNSLPGLIWVTHPIDPDELAVLIVHECSHQYFFALSDAVDLVISSSTEHHYSPFKKTKRPLLNVMLALHAAVNMSSYVRTALEDGRKSEFLRQEMETLSRDIVRMSESVEASMELTDPGKQFLQHLRRLT